MGTANKTNDRRIIIIQLLVALWVAAIGYKLVKLQVADHTSLRARAERQQQAEIELAPLRGIVYDRNGNELARSVEAKSLYASPSEITDPDGAADRLARMLDIDRDALYRRLTSSQVLVAVKRKLSDKEVKEVEALGLPGLRFINEMKRYYVTGQTAAHVVGFVDMEDRGQGGLELSYDKLIRGQGGRLTLDVDALKKSYDHSIVESTPGANITLTIDATIQRYAELALADAVREHHARGGSIVIVRPSTGDILAMANCPTYDPNNVSVSTEIARRNRAVEVSFEPGSIFKLITYSAALEERLIRPDSKIDCGGGEIRIADRIVHDHPYGVLTATQALAKSSNVAAIKLGMRLGNERLGRYIEQFGFGRRTGVELPAEARGLFRPAREWGPTTIGSIPMGHEIGVTAVQAVAAYACIANDGEYVKPHIISRINSCTGEVLEEHQAERRQVVSQATASTLRRMLEGVVMQGTGRAAQMGGYSAAGKTGTAQKVDEKTKRYSQTKYIASFAGFAPVDNPEVACIVSIDEPVGAHHGGDVAAPVFARVVSATLRALGVQPEDDPQSLLASDTHVYDVAGLIKENTAAAYNEADESNPAPDTAGDARNEVDASKRDGGVVMPDLTGLTVREAVALCAARGLKIKPGGEGVVAMQNPAPGALVAQDMICQVRLSKLIRKETAKETRPDAEARKPVEKEPKPDVGRKKLIKKEGKKESKKQGRPVTATKKPKPKASPSRRVVARKN
ncbi:MAG TPA: penicillin-binding protein [Blastocatellia bacterium]|nr:penicillin-binding protein [Blastocatellia bacterium]